VTLTPPHEATNEGGGMGLVRDAARAVTLAATVGILAGGAIGLLAPSFAEAGPSAPSHRTPPTATQLADAQTAATQPANAQTAATQSTEPQPRGAQTMGTQKADPQNAGTAAAGTPIHTGPVIVTDMDLVAGRLEVTLRFTNTGSTVEHIDPAAITVTTNATPLPRLTTSPTFDLRPGTKADATAAFDASATTADDVLTLAIPGAAEITLER
jgi:hypothetical protein